MNAQSFRSNLGPSIAAAVVLGMLAALPAQAGSGLIKVTHASTPYPAPAQTVSQPVAKVQPKVNPAASGEVQVAVMATAPAKPAARAAVFIHR